MPRSRHGPAGLLDLVTGAAPVRGDLTGRLADARCEGARDAGVQAGALGAEQGSTDGVFEQGMSQPVPVVLGRLHETAVE